MNLKPTINNKFKMQYLQIIYYKKSGYIGNLSALEYEFSVPRH